MNAEIVATGTELLTGAVVDSNSAFIARHLLDEGIEVLRHCCMGDDREGLAAVFLEIAHRADIAVVTGGLGPTADDICAEAAAMAAGVAMAIHPEALASVEAFFREKKKIFSPSNRKQAMLPEGATCIHNPIGSAPGFALKLGRSRFFFLPGVPFEMRRMMLEDVIPAVRGMFSGGRKAFAVKTITTFGFPEAAVGEKLAGFQAAVPGVSLGLQALFPEIHLRIYARETSAADVEGRLNAAVDWIRTRLGRCILSHEGRTMEEVVGELLRSNHATLAVAESCTGGLISNLLTDVSGSSDYFLYSGVTYSNRSKVDVLGVSPQTIDHYGAVHENTAAEMAAGARRIAGAVYGLSTTGIAGPAGGTEDKPVGTVCVGLAGPDRTEARRYHFAFQDRLQHKRIFAAAALDLLRKRLMDSPDDADRQRGLSSI